MSARTFSALSQQVMQLHQEKEYTQILELAEKEQAHFPDYAYRIAYWRLCTYALLGKQAEALQTFRETLEQGNWFAPHMLDHDRDLVSLRPLPEFQEMVEVCRQRLSELRARGVQPELLVHQPADQAEIHLLLFAMHGNAGNASTTIENWRGIAVQNWLLAVPQSSQVVGPAEYVWDDRERGTSEIREHLAQLTSTYGISLQHVILGGFSMGGGQAIWMALHQSIKVHGFVVLGPYLREPELEVLSALLDRQKPIGLRGSILVGDTDRECLEISRKVAAMMHAHELACELEIVPGLGHSYPADFGERMAKGLAFIEQI